MPFTKAASHSERDTVTNVHTHQRISDGPSHATCAVQRRNHHAPYIISLRARFCSNLTAGHWRITWLRGAMPTWLRTKTRKGNLSPKRGWNHFRSLHTYIASLCHGSQLVAWQITYTHTRKQCQTTILYISSTFRPSLRCKFSCRVCYIPPFVFTALCDVTSTYIHMLWHASADLCRDICV